jgi:hypothetical protein
MSDKKSWRSKIAVPIVVIMVAGGAQFITRSGVTAYQNATRDYSLSWAEMEKSSEFRDMFLAFKESFPEEYVKFRNLMLDQMKSGTSGDELRKLSYFNVKALLGEKVRLLAQADHNALSQWRQDQENVIHALKEEGQIVECGHFAVSGLGPDDKPRGKAKEAVFAATATQLRLSAQAEQKPVGRRIGEPSDADGIAMVEGLTRNGATNTDLTFLSDLSKAPAEKQCAIGELMLRSIGQMSPDKHDRWMAYIASEAASQI